MKRLIPCIVTAATLLAAPLAAQQKIEEIAPKSTFLVLGVDDMDDSLESFKASNIWAMLQAPEIEDATGAQMNQMEEMIAQMEEQMGIEPGSLKWPSGPVGMAFYMTLDEEIGLEVPGMIAVANFDDGDMVQQLLDSLLEELDANDAPYHEDELRGRRVIVIDMQDEAEPAEFGDIDMDDPQEPGMPGMPMGQGFGPLGGFEQLMIINDGGTLLLSSSTAALEGALSVIDGDTIEAIADSETYQRSLEQIGRGNGHAVLLIDNTVSALSMNPMMMMFGGPMLAGPMEALGLRNVDAISSSFDFGADESVTLQRVGFLVDGPKRGLVALLDVPSDRGEVPSFVGPDNASYARYSFDFSGVMNVIRDALATLPPELRQVPEDYLLQYGADLSAFFTSLGRDVHVVSPPEGGMLAAIQTTAPARLAGVVSAFAPQMGLEPRDFLGYTIYSQEGAPSIGLGGGFLFIGDNAGVEQAMRSLGQGELPTLAENAKFREAVESLTNEPVVGWGYSDTASAIDAMQQAMREGPVGMMGGEMGGPLPDLQDMPDIDLDFIKRFIGPSVWQLRSTDSGFVLTMKTLKPIDEE